MKSAAKFLFLFTLLGCERWHRLIWDPPQPPSAPVSVVCFLRHSGACTPASLSSTLTSVLTEASAAGIATELWTSTPVEPATRVAVIAPFAAPRRTSQRRIDHQLADWASSQAATAAAQLAHQFSVARTDRTQIPQRIAESLALVARAHATRWPRTIILVSDAREVSRHSDAECNLVNPVAFAEALAGGPLPAGSLTDVAVQFWFVTRQQPHRKGCISTPKKEVALEAAWRQVGSATGSTFSFHIGVTNFVTPATAPQSSVAIPKE